MKEVAGIVAAALSIIGYIPYIRDTFRGKTKPHAFSWLVWTLITVIVAIAQLSAGAGWGTIHNLVTGVICIVIVVLALRNKDKDITKVDTVMFIAALLSIPLWIATKNPLASIILLTVIDICAFVPTFRKTFRSPHSETLSSYAIAGIKYGVSLFAITTYTLATLIYPLVLVGMNSLLVGMIVVRRKA